MSEYLSQNLKFLRKQHSMTQELIAEQLKIKATAYGAYERGDTQPPLEKFMKICRMFDVSMDDICNRKIEDIWEEQQLENSREATISDMLHVKVVPYRVQAGYLTNFANPDFYDGFEEVIIPDPGFGKRKGMRAFEVRGDSMLPRIKQNDFVICRKFPVDGDLVHYKDKNFVVITKDSEFLVKKLEKFDPDKKQGVFMSTNPMYKEKIQLSFIDEVAQLWKVEILMSKE